MPHFSFFQRLLLRSAVPQANSPQSHWGPGVIGASPQLIGQPCGTAVSWSRRLGAQLAVCAVTAIPQGSQLPIGSVLLSGESTNSACQAAAATVEEWKSAVPTFPLLGAVADRSRRRGKRRMEGPANTAVGVPAGPLWAPPITDFV